MKETEQLRHQQTLAEKKAQEERRGALLDFAREFERSVASAVDVLAEEVRKVSIASAELSKNAKDSAGGTQQVNAAAESTAEHLQTAAPAGPRMTSPLDAIQSTAPPEQAVVGLT